jgi:hypothetical protein
MPYAIEQSADVEKYEIAAPHTAEEFESYG